MNINPQSFQELNFVETCQTTNEFIASSSPAAIGTSTRVCYSSAVALNEYLLITALFFVVVFSTIKILNLRKKFKIGNLQ